MLPSKFRSLPGASRAISHCLAACALVLSLVACGGNTATTAAPAGTGKDNGIAGKSADDIQLAVIAAMTARGNVEATGTGAVAGQAGAIDAKADFGAHVSAVSLNMAGGLGSGTLVFANSHFYATFDAQLWSVLGGGPNSAVLAGRCLDFGDQNDPNNPASGSTVGLNLLPQTFFNGGPYTKGTVKQTQGVEVQPLLSSGGDEIDIATHGDPLPIEQTIKTGGTGTMTFKNWGTPTQLAVPKGCVSLQSIQDQLQLTGETPLPE